MLSNEDGKGAVLFFGDLHTRADKVIGYYADKSTVQVFLEGFAEPITLSRKEVSDGQLFDADTQMLKWCGGNPPVLTINQVNQENSDYSPAKDIVNMMREYVDERKAEEEMWPAPPCPVCNSRQTIDHGSEHFKGVSVKKWHCSCCKANWKTPA
jgi:formate dehydrogenase maturation protein FdhE